MSQNSRRHFRVVYFCLPTVQMRLSGYLTVLSDPVNCRFTSSFPGFMEQFSQSLSVF
jgi:hypothetical protein